MVDVWKLIAGLGFFLFGMSRIEESLKEIAGRSFKIFLREQTKNPFKALCVGIVATGLLQSSSVVSLIVLAFVGAGIITMRNALGVILGANLGSTFTGWIVAAVGFKLNFESGFIPVLAIGLPGAVFFRKGSRASWVSQIIIGMGFVLMGLDHMKSSTALVAQHADVMFFKGHSPFYYFFFGAILTAVIQSSAATVMLTLSALHAGIVDFVSACAVVIGADLGTTMTAVLGAVDGIAEKKRVALSHVIFNVVTNSLGILLILPLVKFVREVIGISDPLFALVCFHSILNLMGIVMFFPVLGRFADILETKFHGQNDAASKFITKVTGEVPEAALEAMQNEVRDLIERVIRFGVKTFHLKDVRWKIEESHDYKFLERYAKIKAIEREIIAFGSRLQQGVLSQENSDRLSRMFLATRHAAHAAKCIKDIGQDLEEFRRSASLRIAMSHKANKDFLAGFYREILLRMDNHGGDVHEAASEWENLLHKARNFHDESVKRIYAFLEKESLPDVEISTTLNVNREIFSSNKALLAAFEEIERNRL